MATPTLSLLTDPTVQVSMQRVPQTRLPSQFQECVILRVNAVSPGVVRTNLWKNMQDVDPEDMYSHGEKVAPL
jgi:hypothetical protein